MKIKDFIPPVLYRIFIDPEKVEKRPPDFFSTFMEAQQSCSGLGYEEDVLVRTVFEKTIILKAQLQDGEISFSDSMTQTLLAVLLSSLRRGMKGRINIIDFGGACGAHYFQIRPFLPPDVQVDWVVVETHAMIGKARAIETNELHFVASLDEAKERLKNVDLFYSSGTIQYAPSPQTILEEIKACDPEFVFLNRLALSQSTEMITIQETMLSANGPGTLPDGIEDRLCRYPITYFPKQTLEEILTCQYKILLRFNDVKTSMGSGKVIMNSGYYLERIL